MHMYRMMSVYYVISVGTPSPPPLTLDKEEQKPSSLNGKNPLCMYANESYTKLELDF